AAPCRRGGAQSFPARPGGVAGAPAAGAMSVQLASAGAECGAVPERVTDRVLPERVVDRVLPETVVDFARAGDEPGLARLLREPPRAGGIRGTLEREPDLAVGAAVEGESHATIVARRRDGSLSGMGSRSVAGAFVNGRSCRLGYLSQLRLDLGERRQA